MKVKMYGSASFTPVGSGLPGDQIQTRASADIWAGQVANGLYDNYAWRDNDTACFDSSVPPTGACGGDWCYGSYARDDFAYLLANDCCAGCKCGRSVIQDSDPNTGWEVGLSWAQNKRILLRAGMDLSAGAVINYVRVHIKFVYNDGALFGVKPYYQVIGTQGDPTAPFGPGGIGFWGVALTDPNSSSEWFRSADRNIQYSEKLTASPVPGRAFDRAALVHTAWGIWGKNGGGRMFVSEMAIEVGYDESPYVVTTLSASPSSSSATLYGTVDPKGDSGGTWFYQYGLTQFLGTASAPVSAPSTSLYNAVLTVNGLAADTTYYYRLVASDSNGALTYGAIKSFTTVSMCSTRPLLVL